LAKKQWLHALTEESLSPSSKKKICARFNFTQRRAGEAGAQVLAKFPEAVRMNLARRIIPCLDVDGDRVVKGVNFVGLRDAGDPAQLGGSL